jgi:endonuclease/exonuclease/phosphatase family metal-dependent hydrolase
MGDRLPNTLRVTQINAENLFLFFDQELPPNWKFLSEKEWQKLSHASVANKSLRKALWLAESLRDIDADFILVNEVGGEESLVNLNRFFLDDAYRAYVIEGNSDRGIDVGYLVKKSVPMTFELHTHKNRPLHFLYPHEIQSNQHYAESAPEKVVKTHYFSRDCAELRVFQHGGSKPSLIFLLVHLKSKLDPDGIDPEGKDRRAAELKALTEIYTEIRKIDAHVPLIVGGDFNGVVHQEKGEAEFLPLFQTDLRDVFDLLNKSQEEAMTQIQFSRTGQVQLLQIDYLMVSEHLKEHLIPEETFVYRYKSDLGIKLNLPATLDQRLALPSDHYPVVATFKNFLIK